MKRLACSATLLVAASLPFPMNASTFNFEFGGPGVSGTIQLSYGAATDAKYPAAFEVTGIRGTFTDTNNGLSIVGVPIGTLVGIKQDTPEPSNLLAPKDFSRFAVASGLPPVSGGFLTYDNLYWPGGSPQTASDYPFHGGFLDIYGLMFNIGGGRVVDLWSNGDVNGNGHIDYGVAVATSSRPLDYVGGAVSITPEPSALALFCIGASAMLLWRRRASSR